MSVPVDPGTALQDGVDTILLAGTTGLHQRFSNVYNMFNAAISSDNLNMTANYPWTGVHTFDAADLRLKGAGSGVASLQNANTSTNRTITFPDATDTLAGIAATQTFSNKTYASPVLTGDANFDSGTLFVDATNNRVGIGTTSPQYDFHLDKSGIAALAVYGTPTSVGPFTTESSKILFNTRRGTTASPTIVQSGDTLGEIIWNGYDGSDYEDFAAIRCYASTVPSHISSLNFHTFGSTPTLSLLSNGNAVISDGKVGIGTSSPSDKLHVSSNGTGSVSFIMDSALAGQGSGILLRNSRNSTASPQLLQNGDNVGQITFQGHDGSGYIQGAVISAMINGATGTNDMPTDLRFFTTADGDYLSTLRFAIGRNGNIGINSGSELFFDDPLFTGNTSIRESSSDVLTAKIGGNDALQISAPADGETALLIRRNVSGSYSLVRVSMGAADSGGTGYKVLRVSNS